jgi:hypothetical protein
MSDLVEQVARALYEAHHNAGPFADEPIEWGRGGYKTQVATWHAVARAALSVLEPRIEALEAERFCRECGASVAVEPSFMACHCRTMIWPIRNGEAKQ